MSHGYFRLSGYWRYFQIDPASGLNDFMPGTSLSDVLDVYDKDAQLRNLLLEGMAEVEIALRSILVARMCVPGGPGLEYFDPSSYDGTRFDKYNNNLRNQLLREMNDNIERSKERHVVHHRKKAGVNGVPMYVAVESFSFGTLSKMYGLLVDPVVRMSIAQRFNYPSDGQFSSNIRAVAVLRNACAHHSRLWNRHINQDVAGVWPGLVQSPLVISNYRKTVWGAIAVLADMVQQVRKDSSFISDVRALVPSSGAYWDGLIAPSAK